jgi:hypothetical protein
MSSPAKAGVTTIFERPKPPLNDVGAGDLFQHRLVEDPKVAPRFPKIIVVEIGRRTDSLMCVNDRSCVSADWFCMNANCPDPFLVNPLSAGVAPLATTHLPRSCGCRVLAFAMH